MKSITMKGKSADEAVESAIQIMGGKKEDAIIKILTAGKSAMLGIIGGEEAEVEVIMKEGIGNDARQILQDILDRMKFLAMVDLKGVTEQTENQEPKSVELNIKGEDMGRIIGKEGATLVALEMIVSISLSKAYGERIRVGVDAGDYKEKRQNALERLAKDAAEEVASTKLEKVLPPMSASDRRIIHMSLKEETRVTTYSEGVGKERRLVIAPR